MSSDLEKIIEEIRPVFVDVIGDPGITLRPATTAGDIAGWDSFAHINIIVGVEQLFGIHFSTRDIETLTNVGDFAALIARYKSR